MRHGALVVLVVVVLAAGCAGGGEDEELQPGRVRIGTVAGEPPVPALAAQGVRLLVLPCRDGVVRAARAANASGALALAPCDDGVLPVSLRRVFTAGLSPAAQAAALESYVDDHAARLLPPETSRGVRVASLLDLRTRGTELVGADAPERVTPPKGAPDGAVYATYGFPDPGNEADEFYERYRSLHGRRPDSILGVLGTIEFPGGTNRPRVDAAIVRVQGSRLRLVARR